MQSWLRCAQIWIKSAVFERTHSGNDAALDMVKQGLKVYPASAKLHMMHAQLLQTQTPPSVPAAREALSAGLRKCPTAVPLWIMASRLEESAGLRIKARALLEKGRTLNPKSDELWLESVKVEERDGSGAHKPMLARGMLPLAILCARIRWAFEKLTRLSPDNSDPSHARLGPPALLLGLARAPPDPEDALGRCPQEDQQRPVGHRDRRAAVLGRAQDREGTRLVRARRRGRSGLWRRLGVVVEV